MCLNLLIGTVTGFILILIFLFFEKRRFRLFDKTHNLFLVYVLFCALILDPSNHPLLWVGISILLYTVLDDMTTKSLNIYLPLLTTLWFALLIEKPYFIIYSFVPFLILLILIKITKEKIMGEGDAYVFLPLSVLLLSTLDAPSLLFMAERWVEALLLSTLIAAIFITPIKIANSAMDDFAFAPFLMLGFIISYADWTFDGWLIIILFASTVLMVILSSGYLFVKGFLKVKKDA